VSKFIECDGCGKRLSESAPPRVAISGKRTDGLGGASMPDGEFHWCSTCGSYAFRALAQRSEREDAPPSVDRQEGHEWIRTVPTDGRWCERCGLAEAKWNGDPCPGHGAARLIEAQLVEARKKLAARDGESP